MAFFKTTVAALMLLSVSLSVSVVVSGVAEVPSSSPSSSPSPSSGGPNVEEKALAQQEILEKMKSVKSRLEEFISKDIEEWRNDPTSNSKVCLETCKSVYTSALYGLDVAIGSVSEGDLKGSENILSGFNVNIGTCYSCFDEMTESYGTVVNRPESIEKFQSFAKGVTKECFAKFAQYT